MYLFMFYINKYIKMFGTKPEGFKYKNEVKALIREATMELNQRILELETQNRQLAHELYQMKNGVVNDFQVVDRHMTELANMWHPMMMQNITRIQADLEKTICDERGRKKSPGRTGTKNGVND